MLLDTPQKGSQPFHPRCVTLVVHFWIRLVKFMILVMRTQMKDTKVVIQSPSRLYFPTVGKRFDFKTPFMASSRWFWFSILSLHLNHPPPSISISFLMCTVLLASISESNNACCTSWKKQRQWRPWQPLGEMERRTPPTKVVNVTCFPSTFWEWKSAYVFNWRIYRERERESYKFLQVQKKHKASRKWSTE